MPDFDVFLCHNSADKPAVKAIGESLKDAGLKPWLDEWELPPGQPWQGQLQAQIKDIAAAASLGVQPKPRSAAKLPASHKVEIRAEDPASSGTGKTEIVLGEDPTPSVEIELVVVEAMIRGRVVDAEGRGLAGVQISVWGHEGVVTGTGGVFELEAHAPRGKKVRLHAESVDAVNEADCYAGSDTCEIRLVSE